MVQKLSPAMLKSISSLTRHLVLALADAGEGDDTCSCELRSEREHRGAEHHVRPEVVPSGIEWTDSWRCDVS